MAEELTGVKAFVQALRIQTHEYKNKLHTIAGLLQLGHTKQALQYLAQVQIQHNDLTKFLNERIYNENISGLLLSKVSRGKELGIQVILDEESKFTHFPPHLDHHDFVILIGNLIENAFDSFQGVTSPNKEITISIDDNEQANLKSLCDEVFGEDNFISQIIIQSNKRGQTYKQLAKTHEYLLVYSKSGDTIIQELKKELSGNIQSDNISEYSERELRNRNPKYGRFNRPNLFYPIYVNPNIKDENGYHPISDTYSLEYSVEVLPYNSEGGESC